jgi:hypothetical protein
MNNLTKINYIIYRSLVAKVKDLQIHKIFEIITYPNFIIIGNYF